MTTPSTEANPPPSASSSRPFLVYRSDGDVLPDPVGGTHFLGFREDLTTFEVPPADPTGMGDNARANVNGLTNVRNHLFHIMMVKIAVAYAQSTNAKIRRVIEFLFLAMALCCLGGLFYIHSLAPTVPSNCLDHVRDTWPKQGIIRVEIVRNMDEYRSYVEEINKNEKKFTPFSLRDIITIGPVALPPELKEMNRFNTYLKSIIDKSNTNKSSISFTQLFSILYDAVPEYFLDSAWSKSQITTNDHFYYSEYALDHIHRGESSGPFLYIVEYSTFHGLLRLPGFLREQYNVPTMVVQLSRDDPNQCLYEFRQKKFAKFFKGYDDILMNSLKSLSNDDHDKGFLHDLVRDEHYHFISYTQSRLIYLSAGAVMFVFTFAISMLLRFSHHQIFLFIVDLLHMFELNQPLVFPVAPLLTVILALVGIEAIMSEIFNDTTTAFYIILIVWIADQYDAICCQSLISRRYWLRFFYLYHFGFYAYHYRYSGTHAGGALITSSAFILHSMVYFFHHYELPIILYHDEVRRVVQRVTQQNAEEPHERNPNPETSEEVNNSNLAVYIPTETPVSQRDQLIDEANEHGMAIIGPFAPVVGDGTEEIVAERAADEVVRQALDEVFAEVADIEMIEAGPSTSA